MTPIGTNINYMKEVILDTNPHPDSICLAFLDVGKEKYYGVIAMDSQRFFIESCFYLYYGDIYSCKVDWKLKCIAGLTRGNGCMREEGLTLKEYIRDIILEKGWKVFTFDRYISLALWLNEEESIDTR